MQIIYPDNYTKTGLAKKVAQRINTPFYSIDVIKNTAGELRLVEIGDGQVSDIKEWQVEKLIKAFHLSGN